LDLEAFEAEVEREKNEQEDLKEYRERAGEALSEL
jgi:hypothetical protein